MIHCETTYIYKIIEQNNEAVNLDIVTNLHDVERKIFKQCLKILLAWKFSSERLVMRMQFQSSKTTCITLHK